MSGTSGIRQSARVCLILAAIFSRSLLASEPLSIHVSPRVATEPATLGLQVVVERDSENRGLEILVDSADYSRISFVQLDGDFMLHRIIHAVIVAVDIDEEPQA